MLWELIDHAWYSSPKGAGCQCDIHIAGRPPQQMLRRLCVVHAKLNMHGNKLFLEEAER